jgi:TetR/AcrR family transcriptional regulator
VLATHRARVGLFKRGLIREAARSVFARAGIEGASMRAIAAEAGCTTGAIYVHYATKEELYAELLRESLEDVLETLRGAVAEGRGPAGKRRGQAVLDAFFAFYREHPQDFDLSFYLHNGAPRPVGLSPELDQELNARMTQIVDLVGEALASDRGSGDPRHLGTAACASVFGVLLMQHTGRLGVLGQDAEALLDTLVT